MEIVVGNFCRKLADEVINGNEKGFRIRNIYMGHLDGKFEGKKIADIITFVADDDKVTYGIYSGENVIELTNNMLAQHHLAVCYDNAFYENLIFKYYSTD